MSLSYLTTGRLLVHPRSSELYLLKPDLALTYPNVSSDRILQLTRVVTTSIRIAVTAQAVRRLSLHFSLESVIRLRVGTDDSKIYNVSVLP